jgi:regulator of protease activity HflC (stomatin/prohibitin superfamily)
MLGGTLVLMLLVLVVVMFLVMGVRIVKQGFVYTIERLGKYHLAADPGLHIIYPFIDRVGHKINMMEQVLDIPGQEIITKDNAMVGVDAVVFFQVLDAGKAAYEVSGLHNAILALTTTNLRTVMGSMDLDETLSKRDEINARLLSVVDHATSPWGIKITRVEIKDIRPPVDISEAMARQMKAERLKRAEILEAEGKREAQFRDAEARERAAQAEAKATEMVSNAIASSGNQAINYFIAQEYTKAVGKFADSPNTKTILFPVEATQLIGSLGGIGELIKGTFDGVEGTVDSGMPIPAGRDTTPPRRTSVPRSRGE